MQGVIIFAVLLSAVAGYKPSGYISQQNYAKVPVGNEGSIQETTIFTEDSSSKTSRAKPNSVAIESTTSTSTSTSITASQPSILKPGAEIPPKEKPTMEEPTKEETPTEVPISLPPLSPEDIDGDFSKRRVITYDQRQEGQYNIRADLENFMIVLIPPNPADGLNLLELLTKSSLRRNIHSTKSKRKHYVSSQPGIGSKYRQSMKTGNNNQNFNYLSQSDVPLARGYTSGKQPHSQHLAIVEGLSSSGSFPDFIEGRTPYHVDISASDDEQSRLHPDRQVDVLPPPYPLAAYQQLIKPYHLEPSVIQALPPSDINPVHIPSNFFDAYNQILSSKLHEGVETNKNLLLNVAPSENGFYRSSRAIRGDNFLDSNRDTSSNSLGGSYSTRRIHLPIYRSDLTFVGSSLYPPIDVPHIPGYLTLNSNIRTVELNADDRNDQEQHLDNSHIGEIIVPPSSSVEDEIDLDLHTINFMNSDAKDLLSDGLERCAPGRRRDSYGVCREIEGY